MMDIISGILSDCLGAKGLPIGTASAAFGRVMKKRHAMLREVIMAELREGNFDNIDEEALVSVFFRLIRSSEEGVARNNLRLMARVINGMAEKRELKAPTFLKYANILASLTEEEVMVLGIMVKSRDATDSNYLEEELAEKIVHPEAILQALMRTGLVIMDMKNLASLSPGLHKFKLTPLVDEILRYTNFLPEEQTA